MSEGEEKETFREVPK